MATWQDVEGVVVAWAGCVSSRTISRMNAMHLEYSQPTPEHSCIDSLFGLSAQCCEACGFDRQLRHQLLMLVWASRDDLRTLVRLSATSRGALKARQGKKDTRRHKITLTEDRASSACVHIS